MVPEFGAIEGGLPMRRFTKVSWMLRLGLAGILAAMDLAAGADAQPARSLFRTTVLMNNLSNPTHIAFLPDGRIYVLSKSGEINLFDPKAAAGSAAANHLAGTVKVSNVREDGLHSIVLDPDFAVNRRVYLLFGTLTPAQALVVARFTTTTTGDLDIASRKDLLSIPYSLTSSDEHNTGCLAFDTHGNLYIALADNTNNFFSGSTIGYSPRDPKRANYDSQRSAANSNDLRGKILRIKPIPFPDTETPAIGIGTTYTIPDGNLFAPNTPKTRPEIYVMGVRHPFRLTVDPKTGWLFWAEPGPNATADDPKQGPRGYDEVNLAKSAGNYGWPYCVGNNFCYHEYDYQTNTGGAVYDPAALHNTSSNNTGITDLPAARPALVWYPYNATGTAFPVFGNGSANTSMLGPVYNFDPSIASPNKIPAYYDKHLFIFDFSRSLIHAVELDAAGGVVAVKRFWDQSAANPLTNPIDLKVGPDGAFYFLDWGDNGAYPANAGHGNLVRLDYTGPVDALAPAGSTAPGTAKLKESWRILAISGAAREIGIPVRAAAVDLFDLRGARVWSWKRAGSAAASGLELPAGVTGVLRMRIRFD